MKLIKLHIVKKVLIKTENSQTIFEVNSIEKKPKQIWLNLLRRNIIEKSLSIILEKFIINYEKLLNLTKFFNNLRKI